MAFKTKNKNRQIVDERQTLDAKHNNILQSFSDSKTNIYILHDELESIQNKLCELTIKNTESPILNIALQKQIWECDDRKKVLENEIYRIDKNIDETQYMLNTGKLINNYYKIIHEETSTSLGSQYESTNRYDSYDSFDIGSRNVNDSNSIIGGSINSVIGHSITGRKRTIIDWFQPCDLVASNTLESNTLESNTLASIKTKQPPKGKKSISNKLSKDVDTINSKSSIVNTSSLNISSNDTTIEHNILDYPRNKSSEPILKTKDTIYDHYMKLVDKNYININNDDVDIFDSCPKCIVEMLLNNNTGQLICPQCGMMENIIVDSDKPSFKEPPKEMTSFCYKRINHLNEFLAQFQAKETTDIPEDVYNEILIEIKKERINNMIHITPDKMRLILKKIKKNDYYEHIPYIINQLNGLPAPVIAPEIEEIIRGMFKAIQIPFEKYCPNKRKNFLSYNYVMYKFFVLLELDEYLNCFQLLKSRTKLHQQDEIWKNICKDLNWEYIKSL